MEEPWQNHGRTMEKDPVPNISVYWFHSAEAALYEDAIVSIFFLAMVFKFLLESNEGLTQHK